MNTFQRMGFFLLFLPSLAMASSAVHLDQAHVNLGDQQSLQRGAKYFVNYCLGCHALSYMRYSRLGKDLGLADNQVTENLMFSANKIGEPMKIAMSPDDAEIWFGTVPPDLSVVARARGADWLYTYLRGFYTDPSRPFGVNNRVFKDVAMPNVLAHLQGPQQAVYVETMGHDGKPHKQLSHLEATAPGEMNTAEYDTLVRDLVNFLEYTGEPAKLVRTELGIKVLLFLLVFFVLAYLLKQEYWKDVH